MDKKYLVIGLAVLVMAGIGYTVLGSDNSKTPNTMKGSIFGLAANNQQGANNAIRPNAVVTPVSANLRGSYLNQLVASGSSMSSLADRYSAGLGLLNKLECAQHTVPSARRTEMAGLIQNIKNSSTSFGLLNQNGGLAYFDQRANRETLSNNLGSINYALTTMNAFIQNIDNNCIPLNIKDALWRELHDNRSLNYMATSNEMNRLFNSLAQ